MIPGEIIVASGDIELNAGRRSLRISVANAGDRPVQVGSHYHFYETNSALSFDREKAYGCRLNIAAGTAVRFEPGQTREIDVVEYAGERRVYGFNARVMGPLESQFESRPSRYETAMATQGENCASPLGKPHGVVPAASGEVLMDKCNEKN